MSYTKIVLLIRSFHFPVSTLFFCNMNFMVLYIYMFSSKGWAIDNKVVLVLLVYFKSTK